MPNNFPCSGEGTRKEPGYIHQPSSQYSERRKPPSDGTSQHPKPSPDSPPVQVEVAEREVHMWRVWHMWHVLTRLGARAQPVGDLLATFAPTTS